MATYSWALIVIAVFIAVVGVLILSPTKGTATLSPSSCYLTPSLPCYQSVLLTNSSGSQFIALFQNNMGVSMYFPANAISLHPSYSSSTAYSGSCLPQTAPPGATVICNVSIATYSPAVGTQLYPTFTLSYQICPSCATAGAQSYNTSGTSTLTASSFSSVLYSVQLLTSTGTGNIVVGGVKYPSGANVIFLAGVNYPIYAIPPSGIVNFGGWLSSNLVVGSPMQQSTTAQGAINPDPAACLRAAFNSLFYSLSMSVSPSGGGTVTPLGGSYSMGTVVPIYATPSINYAFSSWNGVGTGSYTGSASSASVTMNSAITETANFNPMLTVINSGCTSVSGSGTYNYGSSAQFSAVVPTGAILGWTGSGTGYYSGSNNPGSVTMYNPITETATCSGAYVPITLTNSAGSATASSFPQMITVNSNTYSSYESSGLQNIEFTTGAAGTGLVLYAWCESGCTSTSTSTVWWVELVRSISGSGGTQMVYMNFVPSSMMTGTTGFTGEAPQLYGGSYAQTSYAQYDNGAEIFNYYDNFLGATVGSQYTQVLGATMSISQSNGLTLSCGSGDGGIILNNGFVAGTEIFDADITSLSSSYPALALLTGNTASSGGYWFSYGDGIVEAYMASGVAQATPTPNLATGIEGGVWLTSSSQTWYNNYVPTSGTVSYYSIGSTTYAALGSWYKTGGTSIEQWIRLRAYPPSGAMPTASFGSLA